MSHLRTLAPATVSRIFFAASVAAVVVAAVLVTLSLLAGATGTTGTPRVYYSTLSSAVLGVTFLFAAMRFDPATDNGEPAPAFR